jgi:Uma2 family endonuclease
MATHEPTVETRLVLGPDDHGRVTSAEEFAEAVFQEPWDYERVDGRLVVMAADGYRHQLASEPWRNSLVYYHRDRPDLVKHVFSSPWVTIDEDTDRIGDIGVYLTAGWSETATSEPIPELIFEIVSPGRRSKERDYVRKRADYHKLGIREYVIVDRFAKAVTVLTYRPDGYEEQVLTEADTYTSPLLPGLAIPLAEVFGG